VTAGHNPLHATHAINHERKMTAKNKYGDNVQM